MYYSTFADFFGALKTGGFGFRGFWAWLVDFFYAAQNAPGIKEVSDKINVFLDSIGFLAPVIFIALAFILLMFGRKLASPIKFITLFCVGYVLGAFYITPLITPFLPVPAWVCGIVIAIVSAVVYRFVFYVLYSVAVLFTVYNISYSGFMLGEGAEHSDGKAIISLIIAAVCVILFFVLYKYLEMLLTAAVGGLIIADTVRFMIYDYTTLEFMQPNGWIATLIIILIFTAVGFVFQYKTRRRY